MIVKWFKKKFKQWSIEAWNSERELEQQGKAIAGGLLETRSLQSDATLHFTVYNAVGGKVVEFRYHDKRNDRNSTQMYIISKDDDFGERIAKIATLEALKQ